VIPVPPVPEPDGFDDQCRRRGQRWLAEHRDQRRPRDLWSPFRLILAEGFGLRCGYGGIRIESGTVDHHRAWKTHPELAYEWGNYRYVAEWINKSKQTLGEELLDPYEVGDGWFEISLPDLQMKVTDKVPPELRERANFTLTRLRLRDDERVIRYRRSWMVMYEAGKLTLDGLAEVAPLLAAAVRRRDAPAGAPG
jgi:hypothetical protein